MKRTFAALAALGLLASPILYIATARADTTQESPASAADAPGSTTADETAKDDALKVLEQGFSIPAADGDAKDRETGTSRK